jgi:hypothetical protein
VKNPLTPHFAARGRAGAPSARARQALDFAGFFAAGAARKRVPGLQEIHAGGIMRTALTRACPVPGQAPGEDGAGLSAAAEKTITTGLFTTMHRPFLSHSPQNRSGHVA